MSESTIPAVLQSPVSLNEFKAACGRLRDFMAQLALRNGWCGEWHSYLHGIVGAYAASDREFSWSEYEGGSPDTDYMPALDSIRRRILYFVHNEQITLDIANEGLRATGLAEYVIPEATSTRLRGYLPDLEIAVTGPADDGAAWVRENVLYAVRDALLALDRVESVTFMDSVPRFAPPRNSRHTVPVADTEVPAYI